MNKPDEGTANPPECMIGCGNSATHFCQECAAAGSGYYCEHDARHHNVTVLQHFQDLGVNPAHAILAVRINPQ